MKSYDNELDEMIDVVVKLTWSYTIFRALFGRNDADCEARGAHPEFFLVMQDSLFSGFCVATALLFEGKDKATSICNLVKEIGETKPELAEKLNAEIRPKRGFIDELAKIRHQVSAHRWKSKTPQEVFEEVRPRLRMMQEVTDLARSIILQLAEDAGANKKAHLGEQPFSQTTLQCIAVDAGQVMRAFVNALAAETQPTTPSS